MAIAPFGPAWTASSSALRPPAVRRAMSRRQIIFYIVGIGLLVLWGWHEYSTNPHWRNFTWTGFKDATADARVSFLLLAVMMMYGGYLLRALRWRLLMVPKGRFGPVLSGTVIGFTAIALFGRPGELVRPFYIARRHRTSLSPQIAAWILERVLDVSGVLLIVAVDLALGSDVLASARDAENYGALKKGGIVLSVAVLILIAGLVIFIRYSRHIIRWVENRGDGTGRMRGAALHFLHSLQAGMQPVTRLGNLLLCLALTFAMWIGIAVGIWFVLRAYAAMGDFTFAEGLLIFGMTLAGSAIQLPVVGGGAQVATSLALTSVFGVDPDPAASAALLIWLISFYAITPIGAALAAHEGISWRKLEQEALASEAAAQRSEALSHAPPAG